MARTKYTVRGPQSNMEKATFPPVSGGNADTGQPEPVPSTSEGERPPNPVIKQSNRRKQKTPQSNRQKDKTPQPVVRQLTMQEKILKAQKITDTCCSKRYFARYLIFAFSQLNFFSIPVKISNAKITI